MKKGRQATSNETGTAERPSARETILRAAESLFVERGFDGVSVNDVAMKSGWAKGLVFYHFGDKQGLFDEVIGRYLSGHAERLANALGASGGVSARMRAALDAYLDFIEENPGYPQLIQREMCSGSRSLEAILAHVAPMHQWGLSVLEKALPEKGPLSARQFFVSFFGMAINYFTYAPAVGRLWGSDPMSGEALDERRRHLHLVLDALLERFAGKGEAG